MSVCACVLYSNDDPNARFDMKYYLSTHMPLVAKHWGSQGLKEWKVTHLEEGLGGEKPSFRVKALLYFDSADQIKAAVASESAKEIFGDVPNFTDIAPNFSFGPVVGSHTV